MKKSIFIIIFIILLSVVAFFLLFQEDIYHNSVDNKQWKLLSSKINDDNIDEIKLESIKLIGTEKSDFIKDLSKAKFYKSNWSHEGPTGTIVTLVFKDGSMQTFQYWGNSILETTNNGQYLIKSIEIERVLKKYK